MKKNTFKEGDWVLCDFKLQQITKTRGDCITNLSDGIFKMSGGDLSKHCFPLTLSINKVSIIASYWSREFTSSRIKGLNHPDLHRALVSRWVDVCENIDNEELVKAKLEKLSEFGKSVMEKINNIKSGIEEIDDIKYIEVEGVKLFEQ